MNQYEAFVQLHNTGRPLLIANCWDAGGAKIFQENGFAAVATSSAAIANALGYEDGENLPFKLLFETVKRIRKHISVPFSVDMERGYSNNIKGIIQNIEKLYDIGVAGINLEDSTEKGKLQAPGLFEKTLLNIAGHLSKKNKQVFINARTDAFLLKLPDSLGETKARVSKYENAGASGIFVPFIMDENDIREVVQSTVLPVNVLSVAGLPDFNKLSLLGVRRISLGSSMYRYLNKEMINRILDIREQQSLKSLF